ncbi:MAG: cyclic nucleotide-binding domain-containing protein, partial [Pseudomonadota bacterium]
AEEAAAAPSEADFRWLAPHAQVRDLPAGVLLFAKGEEASSLFIVLEGRVELPEVGATLTAGDMFGEVALFSSERRRTASAIAGTRVRIGEISERRVQQLYFDNPRFAYRLIRLVTGRLVSNLQQAEARPEGPGSGSAPFPAAPARMLEPDPVPSASEAPSARLRAVGAS